MYTMEVFNTNAGWMCRDNDPETLALFGTDTLPTAFRTVAAAETVREQLAKLNPGKRVVVRAGC